ncbi:MAG: hypothetical protein IJF43_04045, partial [Firmicutes bacterium]|nr:hypothetical protein [Bacillota bacterium]
GVSLKEIRKRYGDKVADYVSFVSDDPCFGWRENKQNLIDALKTASADVCILKGADTLSNLRAMAADLDVLGESLWERFRTPKEDIRWYYKEKLLATKEMRNHALTKALFDESKELYEKIFDDLLLSKQWF